MLLLLLPVPNIPAIDAHRDRTIQTGSIALVAETALDACQMRQPPGMFPGDHLIDLHVWSDGGIEFEEVINRVREPLLFPSSVIINSSVASGHAVESICRHHRRYVLTVNSASRDRAGFCLVTLFRPPSAYRIRRHGSFPVCLPCGTTGTSPPTETLESTPASA